MSLTRVDFQSICARTKVFHPHYQTLFSPNEMVRRLRQIWTLRSFKVGILNQNLNISGTREDIQKK